MSYPFRQIEQKWQSYWLKNNTFETKGDKKLPKYYVLDMFPYPSGAGLHVGHPEGYTATDIMARYKRAKGFNVLHPMGWDAFGLPAERYAMQTGIHPSITTANNIANFKRQLQSLGFSYDWKREINTTDPKYYKWTQWIFLQIYNSYFDTKTNKAQSIDKLTIPENLRADEKKKQREEYINDQRLAYIAEMPVNWCAELGTVLANEEVEEWTSKGYTVERKPMRQWMLRITKYAERLLEDLKHVEWPTGTLELQKNWIGKSNGAEIQFALESSKTKIEVFTTRPDTLFGATYMVLAPEHSLVGKITTKEQEAVVKAYIETTKLKSDLDRTMLGEKQEKTGVFTGAYAIHPFTKKQIPIWIADYVLMGYGTGAIMAVPAHDERDFLFAKKFSLEIIPVVSPKADVIPELEEAFSGEGISINSDFLNGLTTTQAKEKMIDQLEKNELGSGRVQYKLRDWLFSRQRYWGEPLPISFDKNNSYVAEDEKDLPLLLPPCEEFKPAASGESPLANVKDWIEFKKGKETYRRESNTMPQWAGSSWYYLRFIDPDNESELVDKKEESYWMGKDGVDLYVGGSEHAVLHLLYARFWHKVLFDLGHVSSIEPFHKLVHQGLILGENGAKMSKSLGNVVNPDDVVGEYGADSFRLFEMFLGPLEQMKPWSSKGIEGVFRFLSRVWRLYTVTDAPEKYRLDETLLVNPTDRELEKKLNKLYHKTVYNVTKDIEAMSFNTAISHLMVFVNETISNKTIGREAAESFLVLLSPLAPHIAEELWQLLGHKESISTISWPTYDEKFLVEDEIEIVFQVNGKVRGKAILPADINEEEMQKQALADEAVIRAINGATPRKIITVKKKLVNIVV